MAGPADTTVLASVALGCLECVYSFITFNFNLAVCVIKIQLVVVEQQRLEGTVLRDAKCWYEFFTPMVSLVALLCLVKASGSMNHTGWQWRSKRRAPGRRYSFTSKGRAGRQAPSTSCSGGGRGFSLLLVASLRVVNAWDWYSLVGHHFFILFVVPMNALCIFCAEALFLSHHVHCACALVISFFNMKNNYDGPRPLDFFNLYLSVSLWAAECT